MLAPSISVTYFQSIRKTFFIISKYSSLIVLRTCHVYDVFFDNYAIVYKHTTPSAFLILAFIANSSAGE